MFKDKLSDQQIFTTISANYKLIKLYNEEMLEEINTDLEIAKVVFIDNS